MGGYTSIQLKDTSEKNILIQNAKLAELGVPVKYHFYSLNDVKYEYAMFVTRDKRANFPVDMFPPSQIHSLEDFQKFWNNKKLASFCPPFGSLNFDCYFGRTSDRAMRAIGKYVVQNYLEIEKIEGSVDDLMERGMSSRQQIFLKNFAKFTI